MQDCDAGEKDSYATLASSYLLEFDVLVDSHAARLHDDAHPLLGERRHIGRNERSATLPLRHTDRHRRSGGESDAVLASSRTRVRPSHSHAPCVAASHLVLALAQDGDATLPLQPSGTEATGEEQSGGLSVSIVPSESLSHSPNIARHSAFYSAAKLDRAIRFNPPRVRVGGRVRGCTARLPLCCCCCSYLSSEHLRHGCCDGVRLKSTGASLTRRYGTDSSRQRHRERAEAAAIRNNSDTFPKRLCSDFRIL